MIESEIDLEQRVTSGPARRTLIKLFCGFVVFVTRGAIAQLGERIVRNDEVVGSIPTSSTQISIT